MCYTVRSRAAFRAYFSQYATAVTRKSDSILCSGMTGADDRGLHGRIDGLDIPQGVGQAFLMLRYACT